MKAIELVRVTTVVPEHLKAGFDAVQVLSRDECIKLWSELTVKGMELLRKRCQLIFHFHKEGWNIHELGNGHSILYLEVAHGRLLPELFTAVEPDYLLIASKLNIPDQQRIVNNESVPVLIGMKENGQPYFQQQELQKLNPEYYKVVMRRGKIQSEAEQIAHERSREKKRSEPRIGRLLPDKKGRGRIVAIGNVSILLTWAELEAALAARKPAR